MSDGYLLRGVCDPSGVHLDIEIRNGQIASVGSSGSIRATAQCDTTELDGQWVAVAGLTEPHAHFDKAYTASLINARIGDLQGAVDAFEVATMNGVITREGCEQRAQRALQQSIDMGCTAVRTHVDCGVATAFDHLSAVQSARSEFGHRLTVQTVALVYQPVAGPEGRENRRAMERAVEAGATAIGGAPQFANDSFAAIDVVLQSAAAARLPLDLHIDETLDTGSNDLTYLAQRVIETGHAHPVTASHCVSLGQRDAQAQLRTANLVREAGIAVVVLPETNLLLQGRAIEESKPRGLTALGALLESGVPVAAGSDNTEDPFNPMGRLDPIQTASLMVSAGHLRPSEALELVTNGARAAMGLPRAEIAVGHPADLTLIPGTDARSALASGGLHRQVLRAGRLAASPAPAPVPSRTIT